MPPFLLSVIEGRKPELDFLLFLSHRFIIFQCLVHHRRICKLTVPDQSSSTFQNPVHNTGEFIGDNLFSQIGIDSVFGNLYIERCNQESPVKASGYIIFLRKFIKAKHHLCIVCQCCNIFIENLITDRFLAGYSLKKDHLRIQWSSD